MGHQSLWAEKDGKEFSRQRENPVTNENPVTKVNFYKKAIFNLYCPRLQAKSGFAAITAGVIFPCARAEQVKDLLSPFLGAKYQPISGADEISAGNLKEIFPEAGRSASCLMTEDLANDLRGWLVEPDFSSTQRTPLVLDGNQENLAETRTETGYRRIKGPAGSGKSLVLAARAAELAKEGKSVLVATYNITLWHYLRDLIVRDLDSPEQLKKIQFKNFHLWCKDVCHEVGWGRRYDDLWKHDQTGEEKNIVNNIELPRLAKEAVMQEGAARYHAILVDEGQDYQPLWWDVLRKACRPEGEMLLVADATQDIYGTAKAWTDDVMKGAGFGGRWSQLSVSYRLPPDLLTLARKFAETFLPKDATDLPEPNQKSLDLYPCHLRWVQCDPENAEKACYDEILSLMCQTGKRGLANADITVLADVKHGEGVVKRLSKHNIRAVNTFGPDKIERRRRKMAFYMGDARIKATTLHSFKGWETRLLVLVVTEAAHATSLALIYAGLTRLKRSQEGSWLTVVCSAPQLQGYGATFPDHTIASQ